MLRLGVFCHETSIVIAKESWRLRQPIQSEVLWIATLSILELAMTNRGRCGHPAGSPHPAEPGS